ncbi:FAD-dependent oxidoreductase [uncultured Tistrella sp.]|uniref:hydroxysqualene dehydroxylase n=1 Tax=Tistrella mobilis TaxID=171437 RepID=UPI00262E9BEC|nr:FAD-dependent oxidoreductase [uncultured Tistrella sp.]
MPARPPRPTRVLVAGAGIAGLAAALDLAEAGLTVELLETAPQAGGRCRSFDDPVTGHRLDNGTHVLLGANPAALDFVRRVGGRFRELPAIYPAVALDGPGGEITGRHEIRLGSPLQLMRSLGLGAGDLLALAGLLLDGRVNGPLRTARPGLLSRKLGQAVLAPLVRAALNIDPAAADARLVARMLRRLALAGPRGFRLHLAEGGLDAALIAPAVARLRALGVRLYPTTPLDRLPPPDPDRMIVLALPPAAAHRLLPNITVPRASSAILNIHYALDQLPAGMPEALMVTGGMADWIFHRDGILSITTSAADALMDRPAEVLAATGWAEIRTCLAMAGLPAAMPPVRVVKEKRATMRHDPGGEALRPGAVDHTRPRPDVVLAGDWTATGLPATIEGAVVSGQRAAAAVLRRR